MLSLERFKELNKKYNYNFNDNELKMMREILYLFAEIQINAENKLIKDEECNTILQSELRRAKDKYKPRFSRKEVKAIL